jgi:hypothetical protein
MLRLPIRRTGPITPTVDHPIVKEPSDPNVDNRHFFASRRFGIAPDEESIKEGTDQTPNSSAFIRENQCPSVASSVSASKIAPVYDSRHADFAHCQTKAPIAFRAVSKQFPGVVALRNVSFDFDNS